MGISIASPQLVGRGEELDRLEAALDAARAGHTTRAVLVGEAGVGKSRLLTEFAAHARERGTRVLLGTANGPGGTSAPYTAIAEALREHLDRASPDQGDDPLAPLSAVPGPGSAAPPPGPLEAGSHPQGRLFAAVRELLTELAAERPVLLAIEDLHEADPSTRALVGYLAAHLGDAAVLLLVTARSDALPAGHEVLAELAELARGPAGDRVELPPLTRDELATMVASVLGVPADAGTVDEIHARSDGNPFFAEELLAALRDADDVLEVPGGLRDLLLHRVDRLGRRVGRVLRVAAVCGRRIDAEVVATVAGEELADVEADLAEAGRWSLVRHSADERALLFRHALLREALLGSLVPTERTRLHAAAAAALAARDAPAAHVADHLQAAGAEGELEARLAAAAQAEAGYAYGDAHHHLTRVLALVDLEAGPAPGIDDPAGLLVRAASTARWAGDYHEAERLSRRALELAGPHADPALYRLLAKCQYLCGDLEGMAATSEAALASLPVETPAAERALVLSSDAIVQILTGHPQAAISRSEEALALAPADALVARGQALNARGLARQALGDGELAVADLETATRLAHEAGDVETQLRSQLNLSHTLAHAGRLEECVEVAATARLEAERHGDGWFPTMLAMNELESLLLLGRWSEAEQVTRRLARVRRLPMGLDVATETALLELVRGDLAEVRRLLGLPDQPAGDGRYVDDDDLPGSGHGVDDQHGSTPRRICQARVSAHLAAWEHRYPAARAHARTLLELVGATDGGGEGLLAAEGTALWLRAAADELDDVHAPRPEAAARLRVEARQLPVPASGDVDGLAAGWAATARAEAARLERDDKATGRWREAGEVWASLGAPFHLAYVRWRAGQAQLAAGDRAAARDLLRRAHAQATDLGAAALVREVEATALRARIEIADDPPPSPAPRDPFGLTEREREVLDLLTEGLTNPQIGERLYISPRTASVHVSRILRKLEVTTRGEAAALAHRLELTAPGST